MTPIYPKIHVIVNPASGPNRPILNTFNDVFRKHGVDWDVSITKRYGDARRQAKDAIARGVDWLSATAATAPSMRSPMRSSARARRWASCRAAPGTVSPAR